MSIQVVLGDPHHVEAVALLRQSHALMEELFPAESNHYLSIDALCEPNIRFFHAKVDDRILGCAALAIKDGYGEIKSMFVSPDARGTGLAQRLMEQLESCARDENLPMMKLETGYLLEAAHKLYHAHGFTECAAFGDYEDDPINLFMEKTL
ncbi:GNAT family N-acetyltransferase [Cochlodiniinecator piscidefendens]|uniref:GNAT family N-acetyltransferase n=1 Tax=Cochlodiniinecator piscidefendens TaxID=2715756 RepID=UPI00140BF58D|nr:GNAT family N-acetyltransferase [Cochlodiniinecator piscidefendens]